MSGWQTSYGTAGPIPTKETIYIATAPPAEPSRPPATATATATFKYSQTNRQSYACYAAFFLFIYGGMDLASSLGWNQTYNIFLPTEYMYSWFVGVIIGALAATITASFLPRLFYYVLAGVMELTGSIIFTAVPDDYESCLAARYVAGVGVGLLTVPFLIHNAEVSANHQRGVSAGMEQCGLAMGISVQVVYTMEWAGAAGVSPNLVHGIVGIVFTVLGLAMCFLIVESPIFHLQHNREEKARQCQEKLLGNLPSSVNKALEQAKIYVEEGRSRSWGEDLVAVAMPFLKLLLFRCFVAFSFSLPLTLSMTLSTAVSVGYPYAWPMYVWGALRLISTLVALGFLDTVGRKAVSLVGLLCMAGLMLGLAGIYANGTSWYNMAQISNIGMAFQAFAGLFVCSSSVYLGEGFPMRLKPFLVGLIVIVEQVIQIIVIACVSSASGTDFFFQYFLAVGIILLLGLIYFAIAIPETKKMTLREAGQRFQRLHDVRIY